MKLLLFFDLRLSVKDIIQIIYDGHCPLCKNFTKLLKLRTNFNVVLLDARENFELSKNLLSSGYNLDKGMLVSIGDQRYFGYEAMWVLASISSNSNFVNKIFSVCFSNKKLASMIYPVLVLGRNGVLFFLSRKKLFPE